MGLLFGKHNPPMVALYAHMQARMSVGMQEETCYEKLPPLSLQTFNAAAVLPKKT